MVGTSSDTVLEKLFLEYLTRAENLTVVRHIREFYVDWTVQFAVTATDWIAGDNY